MKAMNQFKEWKRDAAKSEVDSAKLVSIYIIVLAILIALCSCNRHAYPKGYKKIDTNNTIRRSDDRF